MSDEAGTVVEGGEQGGSERGWLNSVPENLRGHEAFKDVSNMSDVFQRYADLTVKSKDALVIPGEDATDEERASFYQKLGKPETAEQYQFDKPEGLPEGYFDEKVEAVFKQVAFENDIPLDKAKGLYNWYWNAVKEAHNQQVQATEKAIENLKNEWKGDSFKENTELATRAFKEFAGDESLKFIEETVVDGVALGNHPMFLKLFSSIGKAMSDDKLGGDRGDGIDVVQSDEERAKARFPNTQFKT